MPTVSWARPATWERWCWCREACRGTRGCGTARAPRRIGRGATSQPTLLYAPPKLTLSDQPQVASSEAIAVAKDGAEIAATSLAGFALDPGSDPGCAAIPGGYRCPAQGIERLRVRLGKLTDLAEIDLGSLARDIRTTVEGGSGEDEVGGGPGRRRSRAPAGRTFSGAAPGTT